ncbi:MAG: hypothetical protein LBU90_10285 [Bacteroidales bacterium]|nr:hypothetical protein [Bacteroidales bacterium]
MISTIAEIFIVIATLVGVFLAGYIKGYHDSTRDENEYREISKRDRSRYC